MRIWLIVYILLSVACSSEGEDVFARERALPMKCRVNITLDEARGYAGAALPTAPITFKSVSGGKHLAEQDRLTGKYTITLASEAVTSMGLAHELAHVAVFEMTRVPGNDPKDVPIHGELFVKTYKFMLARLVSKECADGL